MGLGRRERKMEAVCVTRFRPVALGSDERANGRAYLSPVVRQIVVHHIKRISFSLAEVLRFGIAC
jgi:hypothetical protein